ncbi:MAG TPA: serine hydrolase domain-containing protein [Anaerolineaceae bacterium]|nr:serine hydrolase domain-containing protein [Anaerolineaceae bacterium]
MTTNTSILNVSHRKTIPLIAGFVRPGFEAVREAFAENFIQRGELGAAACMYYQGEKVVDLWGGVRNKATGEPWEEDTMVIVHSTTKGMAGMAMALANSHGWLDYEEKVCTYWPEFAQNGKEKVTVRQLLSHQAGLLALDGTVNKEVASDLDRLAVVLAQQKPAWEPGTRQGYHGISLGFYENELMRRVDPNHRSIGRFFQEEIATPLGLEFYIRLPETMPNARLAKLEMFNPLNRLVHTKPGLLLASLNPRSLTFRAMFVNPGVGLPFDKERIYSRELEVPSQGGVGTARAIARAYSSFATGGIELGLRNETLQALMAPGTPPKFGFFDECLKITWPLSLGFMKPCPLYPIGSPAAFGTPGAGGSFGFADPQKGIGYAYVTNQMGVKQGKDPRELALRDALYQSIGSLTPFQPGDDKINNN